MTALERDCYRVVAYFDIFHYPVTAFEVWKWLYAPTQPWTFCDVMTALRESTALRSQVHEYRGFYGLGDVAVNVADRQERFLDALRKYRRLMRVLQYLARLPHVEGIAVCNSLAFHHTTAESDIDLFLITQPRRVWTVRFLAVAAMAAMRLRPGEARQDPVCCSFFVDHDLLPMAGLKIAEDDPYLAMWHATLTPLVDRGHVFARLRAENAWVSVVLPHAPPTRRPIIHRRTIRWQLPGSLVAEETLRTFQERRLNAQVTRLKNKDSRVVVNNKMLKFHENDRRAAIAVALEEKLSIL